MTSLSRRRVLAAIGVLLATSLTACEEKGADVRIAEELEHTNGLRTVRPQGFRAVTTAAGFEFDEEGELRSPKRITIARSESKPELAADGAQTLLDGEEAQYAIQEFEGGPGGAEYQLTAWRRAAGGWIVMTAYVQVEHSDPDFAAGWAVLGQTRLSKAQAQPSAQAGPITGRARDAERPQGPANR